MDGLRAAVVGLGFMGGAHIEALRRLGIAIVGCLGQSAEDTLRGIDQYGLAGGYASLDELVSDPAVDVVHICTPNYLHFDQVKAVLGAGKHVVCEKPLTVTSQELGELVRLIRSVKRVGAVNYNIRFYPLCHDARSRILAGELGEVRLIHGHYLQDWLLYPTDWNWRLETDKGGQMRAVTDIGTHWFDLLTWITGLKISAVMADLATIVPTRLKPNRQVDTFTNKLVAAQDATEMPIKTEDYASILFEAGQGVRGVLTVSQVSAGHKNQLQWEVNGTQASMGWQAENPNEMWIGRRDGPNEIIAKDPALMRADGRSVAGYPGGHAEGYPDTFKQLFNAVYHYIAQGDFTAPAPFPTFDDGHAEIVLCDAIQRSANERRWVTLD